jgi:hypothetical protein
VLSDQNYYYAAGGSWYNQASGNPATSFLSGVFGIFSGTTGVCTQKKPKFFALTKEKNFKLKKSGFV